MKMTRSNTLPRSLCIASVAIGFFNFTAGAATVVTESFDDLDPSLDGNLTGSGLSGTWTAGAAATVETGSLGYGANPTSGGRVAIESGNRASAALGSDLMNSGLLMNGRTLWFSAVIQVDANASTNDQFGFAIGSSQLGTGNFLSMGSGESGIGITVFRGNRLNAASWNNSLSQSNLTNGFTRDIPTLVVGKITWGATDLADDMIEVFIPGIDLALPGTAHATHLAGALNQSSFDTITFSRKGSASQTDSIDEIRFGETYADVVGTIPEPSSGLLMALAGLSIVLIRRRS